MQLESASFLARLHANISLYFPFLVYYHISYYKSSLFPLSEMGYLAQQGLPEDDGWVPSSGADASTAQVGLLTVRILVATALVAADPKGLAGPSSGLLGSLSAEGWLDRDWPSLVASGWPLFGSLAVLRDSAWLPSRPACSKAAQGFELELQMARAADETLDLTVSLTFLEDVGAEGNTGALGRGCSPSITVLMAAAHLAIADWERLAEYPGSIQAARAVDTEIRHAQVLVQTALGSVCANGTVQAATSCIDSGRLGLDTLAVFPGGAELLWLLDRLQCRTPVRIVVPGGQTWVGAENLGIRSVVDVAYWLAVFPHRELVSDFVRARGVPYCNESILRVVERLARRLQARRASRVRIVEVGANIGDCMLFAVQRLRAVPGLQHVEAVAVEASAVAARLLESSVRLNGLGENVQVFNMAASGPRPPNRNGRQAVRLLAKPRSSNSFTEDGTPGGSTQAIEVPAAPLDEMLHFPHLDLLISHTNGQELGVLRGASRLFKSPRAVGTVVLQLYGPDTGIVRTPTYDPGRPVRWLANRGYFIVPSRKPWRRLGAPGTVGAYFRAPGAQKIVNVVAEHWRSRLPRGPGGPAAAARERGCLHLAAGERPRSWAEVDGRVLRENLHLVRVHLGRARGGLGGEAAPPIGAVLKANAYGHGAVLAGRVLASAKVDALFVSEVETALELRAAPEVHPSLPIILLYRAPDWEVFCMLAAANVTSSVLSLSWIQQAVQWHACAAPVRLHLMVDSGLSREGVLPNEVVASVQAVLAKWPQWSFDGIYTHWCCPYDPGEMRKSKKVFDDSLAMVAKLRVMHDGRGGNMPFTIHASSSSTVFYGADYDLLRVGGLLFGDPVTLTDSSGDRFIMPGPHRTLLWKSRIMSLHRALPGSRYARCIEQFACLDGPLHHDDVLLGTIPVGGDEFSHSLVLSARYREKLPLLEKASTTLIVHIPADSRTYQEVAIGMEVLLCETSCIQGLFALPQHVPRVLVNDPSIELPYFCPPETFDKQPSARGGAINESGTALL